MSVCGRVSGGWQAMHRLEFFIRCCNQVTEIIPDIDECLTNHDNCTSSAECVNTPGSFQCRCRSGFERNGLSCRGMLRFTIKIQLPRDHRRQFLSSSS